MAEERVLDKVRKLLDRANHPGTNEHEREACIQKADSLMLNHGIEQAMLDALASPNERRKPVHRQFRAWETLVWRSQFSTIMREIARTVGVRANVRWDGHVDLVGMSDDVDYCEMLWTQIYFTLLSQIDPSWDDNLSFDHNVYNFKKAGFKWPDIRDKAMSHNHHVPWPDGGMLIRAYKRHAKMIGDDRPVTTQRHSAYRQSFVDSFETTVCMRMEELRRSRKVTTEEAGPSAALALIPQQEAIDEAYYVIFPDEHPDERRKRLERLREDQAEREAREAEERQKKLDAMTPKQRQAFLEMEERKRRREAEQSDRYWQREAERNRGDAQGRAAGRKAGESVDLIRKTATEGGGRAGELR